MSKCVNEHNYPICSKCGAEIVPFAVGPPHEKTFVEDVCQNCIKLKLARQIKTMKI